MEITDKQQQQQDPNQHVASSLGFQNVGTDNLLNGDAIKRVLIVTQQADTKYQDHTQPSTSPFQQPYTTTTSTNDNPADQYHTQYDQNATTYLIEDPNNLQQEQNHYQQHQVPTNGHDQFYADCQQQEYLPSIQPQYNNNQDKLYTNLDQQQQHHQEQHHQQQQFQQQLQHQAQGVIHNNHQQQNTINGQINQRLANPTTGNNNQTNISPNRPYVEIVEQPARCALRFRYKCEGRSAGSLPGASSTIDNKTFPSIRINNYRGRAVVVISTVTRDEPYKAHPHNIVGREGCKKGICTIVINATEPSSVRSFPSLGIQCVKRRDIEESLGLRESIHVDPFREGFEHKHNSSSLDLNAVRLCFQVFIEGSKPGKCDVPLMPIVSSPIHDKKAMSDLVITKLSHCSAPATGGREVILLCDRITKEDIKIRFFEERQGRVHWEAFYEPTAADIHKQVAICFKTPKYLNENIQAPVMVRIQLKRISDNQVSESRPFQFLPCESDEDIIHRKRQKIDWVNPERYALR